ncbi:MAG: mechanosensitive ion channel family protein [Candidatus Latescibacterota bacterium]|nr:MAG: mechanosensitive ion channel family protein [Candidatus Latescibacterota bacterium]
MIADVIVARVFRAATSRTKTTIDDAIIDLIHRPVRVSVVLVGLWIATIRLELPAAPALVVNSSLKTLAVLVWSAFVIRFVSLLLETISRADGFRLVEPRTRTLFDNLTRVVVIGLAIYAILLFWNVNVSAWLASAGIIGLAVGFAAKDTLANLFSGIFILTDAPYEIGDYINLDTGERGQVTHVGLRSTRLLTRDDVEVTIPNAVIANAKIVNETGGRWPKERIRVKVGVAYGSDVDRLREILNDIALENPQTAKEPEPRVRFRRFGESSLDFELLCWIDEPVLRGRVLDALNTEIYKRLAQEGIEIPYPKRDVYIKQMPTTNAGKP